MGFYCNNFIIIINNWNFQNSSRGIDAVFNTSVGGDYYYKGALS